MKRLKKIMYIILGIIVLIGIGVVIFTNQTKFGKLPSGERLKKIQGLPNYKDGKFQNLSQTKQFTGDKPIIVFFFELLLNKNENVKPKNTIPSEKINLKSLPKDENILVWLGHSAYFMQLEGKTFLIDPTLVSASPISFFNKEFKGTNVYKPEDIPEIDYLIITHDHWDHLDYETVIAIKPRVKHIVTSMGIGEHFEYWGFEPSQITELNWNDKAHLTDSFIITSLPARHFSGRGLIQRKTLWSSFMLQSPNQTIYIGGDSGYDNFYLQIKKQFPNIDYAILENGQYNENWEQIHALPEDFTKIVKILQPKYTFAFHNSKYALANHHWKEPMEKAVKSSKENGFKLLTPIIGQAVYLDGREQNLKEWWKNIE